MKNKNSDKLLKDIYFNAKHTAGFGGKSKLTNVVKGKIPRHKIDEWLSKTDTYNLHKPARKKFKRRKFVVTGLNALWQTDLTDLNKISNFNDGNKYILLNIDVFSRRANAIPIKSKSGRDVTEAFEKLIKLEGCYPKQLQTDDGKEFFNSHFQSMLKGYKINHYKTYNQEIKASLVERLQRTIKSKMFRYFTHTGSYRYLDVLQDLVSSYNNTVHSSTNLKPIAVTTKNQEEIWQTIYNPDEPLPPSKKYKFEIGGKVRVSKYSTIFAKGYLPNWSEEIFTIIERHKTSPPVYSLIDESGSKLRGTWYEPELQKVSVQDNTYKIESILGKRKVNNKIQYLVRWKGYPPSFDSYVDKKDIISEYKN